MSFRGHTARKRFGQHWLRDERVLDQIVAASDLVEQDHVLEVGPGRGALTERLLASSACCVHAVELDRDLVAGLHGRFGADPRFSLREGDVWFDRSTVRGPSQARDVWFGFRAILRRGPSRPQCHHQCPK